MIVMANKRETKRTAEGHVSDGEVEKVRGNTPPRPVEPSNAGSKIRQTQPPIYPQDYDTSTQPNEPQVPTPPKDK